MLYAGSNVRRRERRESHRSLLYFNKLFSNKCKYEQKLSRSLFPFFSENKFEFQTNIKIKNNNNTNQYFIILLKILNCRENTAIKVCERRTAAEERVRK